jgi:hypothetical protein
MAATKTSQLRTAPDGEAIALVSPLATLEPLAHDHGWVRVRVEGWLPDSAAVPASGGGALSAADLRANPDAARGRTVRWDVEVLAMAAADPLRKGLNPDEPYLLVRGPGRETALSYLAIPPRLLATARAIASAAPTSATMVATVRVGRSEPAGVPILDAQVLARR